MTTEGIQVKTRTIDGEPHAVLIVVSGYVDSTTSRILDQKLEEEIRQGNQYVILDLGRVEFISSAGWGILFGKCLTLRQMGGDLKLIHLAPDIMELFEFLEFGHYLNACGSIEEALEDFHEERVDVRDRPWEFVY